MRHELLTQQRSCRGGDFFFRAAELDPAGLAAPTGMDLRLYDPDRSAETPRRLDRLGGGVGHPAARHRNTEFRQQLFRLIFVDVHSLSLPVTPANAGVQGDGSALRDWVPAYAGM